MSKSLRTCLYIALTSSLIACSGVSPEDDRNYDDAPPLTDLDALLNGAPKADDIERIDRKSDEFLPAAHTDLLATQTEVRSQGKRGVCSIFSTVALMEHLYLAEGSTALPDFSEQYLQWSAKFEVESFPNTSGSNATVNLESISKFGVVAEADYPYQDNQWGTAEDERCDGEDSQPTVCYTNGQPSDEVKDSEKFFLPRGRWLHSRDIKSHIQQTKTGAVVGLTFFYQSWNHRSSKLPRSLSSWNSGFVTYPSAADKAKSLEKRAGHSILLVGWDDEQLMPTFDEEGNKIVDSEGNAVFDKGCYVFKNSWGTSGFGIDSDWGPGYGCISYKYVHEYGRVRVAGLPTLAPPDEVCDDGVDNDGDDLVDCDDDQCNADEACVVKETNFVFDGDENVGIPDNDEAGISSTISVSDSGTIESLQIDVDISHTYKSDLHVSLHRGEEVVVLHNNTGSNNDDVVLSLTINEFNGQELAGDYQLVIVDSAREDIGILNSWSLTATTRN